MTDVELDNSAQLEQRVRELEAENARPVADFGVAGSDAARGRRRGRWWRALPSAVCIVLAAVVLPVAIVAAWTRVQLVDESQFVTTLAPLATRSAGPGPGRRPDGGRDR